MVSTDSINIDGEIFRRRRKELNFSQVELAEGIASQGTISSLECCGTVPCLRILGEIMNRLHLTFDEILDTHPISTVLADLQKELDGEHYRRVFEGLERINKNDLLFPQDQQRVLYLKASASFHGGRIEDAAFYCDQLIQIPDKDRDPLYFALVNTIKAQVWQQKNDLYKAGVCFQSVYEFLLANPYQEDRAMPSAMHGYVRMYQALAEHALMNQDLQGAKKFVKRALKMLSSENSSWHLGELLLIDAMIAGKNMLEREKSLSIIAAQRLYDITKSPKLGRMLKNI